ncbi:glycosyltransferase family 92 protein [Actinomyces trachealis]|uniref:glycosyltransferase family 92 protein n=1 Tax=Actinomyces trachealis TaxID=2763540 RepID=UPI001892B30A|nr:glycosyltransferase family 92 protein [Actinomyces trachealis]
MKVLEITPASIILPNDFPLKRDYARPSRFVTEDYIEKYDDNTLFYDVFIVGREIVAVSPPLLNLEFLLSDCRLVCDGEEKEIQVSVESFSLERTQLSRIRIPDDVHSVDLLRLYVMLDGKSYTFSVAPALDMNEPLRNRKGLMTLQLNNELDWIEDWARYYQGIHGVDAVVVYDNGSSSYSSSDIAAHLSEITDLKTVIVVHWPFKYGPQGKPWAGPDVPWDSDFCQIGALQDASLRFFAHASFINADIDEFIVPLADVTVFDALEGVEGGVLGVVGQAIAPVSSNVDYPLRADAPPRVFNLWEKGEVFRIGGRKWVGRPERWPENAQCTAHYVRKVAYEPDSRFSLAHFMPVNNGWKRSDRIATRVSHEGLRPDFALVAALFRAFPEKVLVQSLCAALVQAENIIVEMGRGSVELRRRIYQMEIASRVPVKVDWLRIWVWRDNVFVYEATFDGIGTVAFDLYPASPQGRLVCTARNRGSAPRLREFLSRNLQVVASLSNGIAFVTHEYLGNPNDVNEFRDWAAASIGECVSALFSVSDT